MNFTAGEICRLLNGRLEGNPETLITHPARIEDAQAGAVTFIANPKYAEQASTTKASVLLVGDSVQIENKNLQAIIRVDLMLHLL